jgi:hypothetical protein
MTSKPYSAAARSASARTASRYDGQTPGVDRDRRGIGKRNCVVGHAQDVEACLAVHVDEVAQRQKAVAPRRVRMKLTEEKAVAHVRSMRRGGASMGNDATADV